MSIVEGYSIGVQCDHCPAHRTFYGRDKTAARQSVLFAQWIIGTSNRRPPAGDRCNRCRGIKTKPS